MLEVHQVHKRYTQGSHKVHALRGVDLEASEPGFFAVMGPSGSGKSTLLHLLAGLDRPDEGRVCVAGEEVSAMSERKLTRFRRRRVGVVFQQFNLIPTLTTRQNIALPAVLDGRPRAWVRERVDQLMDRLGIADRADHRPEAMSGGEQQRAAIARALVFEPPLLLADEPTGNLDSASSDRLWALLGELAAETQVTALMVTHEPAAAARCSRVFVLSDGACRGSFQVNGMGIADVATRYQQLSR